jgi:uncharacterized protein involved in exopolysaccharide biosynthesis
MEENTNMEIQPEETPPPEDKPAALTLVIQSWATPIVGIVMLVVGLFGGYYLRPVLLPTSTSVALVEETASSDAGDAPNTIPTPDTERAVQQQELMTAVVERTRHFRGDPDAPVTIIEFSDFQ